MSGKEEQTQKVLREEFQNWSGKIPDTITALPPSGSYRRYYRMISGNTSAIGAVNPDLKENLAFLTFSRHFRKLGIAVPEIYSEDKEGFHYLLEDLGDTTLIDFLTRDNKREFTEDVIEKYKNALTDLASIQLEGIRGLDTSKCYPRAEFDEQSVLWDLNYFKHYFLKFAKVPFDEQLLEDDFKKFAQFLAEVPRNYFLYRDFQSRNIMLHRNKLYYIDFQGGRRGALQYDVASILFESKTFLPFEMREELLQHYSDVISKKYSVSVSGFLKYYPAFLLIRLLQAMGAYGFRGLHENKPLFLESIPGALKNLEYILGHYTLGLEVPELMSALKKLSSDPFLVSIGSTQERFTLRIKSFSFKTGIPFDETLNGGGFVFDCRSLPNPGRYEEYKKFTGKDEAVIKFFSDKLEVKDFLSHINALADSAIHDYKARGLANMMISFGCTGGRHRSVYCAERLFEHIKETLGVDVNCIHTGIEET
jgi:aminoglycoside/choline kinase family phosphotransferase